MPESWPPTLPKNCPLSPHARGYQARIAGKVRWIAGKVSLADAMRAYHRKAAALTAGVSPIAGTRKADPSDRTTFYAVLNRWILDRRDEADRGNLASSTFYEYKLCAKRLDAEIGEWLVDEWGPDQTVTLHRALEDKYGEQTARRILATLITACHHAMDRKWIAHRITLGRVAGKLSARPKSSMKWKLYTPEEIRRILVAAAADAASTKGPSRTTGEQLQAMILMALNGGYGAKELSDLPRAVVDLDNAVIDHNRGKTGAQHMVTLWPETVAALRKVFAQRPGDDLVFRTREGRPWCRRDKKFGKGGKLAGSINADNVAWRFNRLVKPLGLKGARGSSFYKLRHLHSTTAEECGDIHATFCLLGHALPGSKGNYVKITVDRMRKVTDALRERLILS